MGHSGQVAGVFVEGAELFRLIVMRRRIGLELGYDLCHSIAIYLEASKNVSSRARHVEYGQEHVLRRDELFLESRGHAQGIIQYLHQIRRYVYLIRRRKNVGTFGRFYVLQYDVCHHGCIYLHLVEDRGDHALFLQDQGAQKVHGIDVVLAALNSELVGPFQGFSGFGCEFG